MPNLPAPGKPVDVNSQSIMLVFYKSVQYKLVQYRLVAMHCSRVYVGQTTNRKF